MKKFLKTALLFIIILAVAAFSGLFFIKAKYDSAIAKPLVGNNTVITFTISEGESFSTLLDDLDSKKLLESKLAIKFYVSQKNLNPNIKAGDYSVSSEVSLVELIDRLEETKFRESITVTIREGYRIDEVAADIEKQLATEAFKKSDYLKIAQSPDSVNFSAEVQNFLTTTKPKGKSLEGYLFPETYEFFAEATAQDVIEKQISTLLTRLNAEGIDLAKPTSRLSGFYEVLTLASIVEREAQKEADRKNVADIFLKRLEEGISLGSDVTLLYPLGRWKPEPTIFELDSNSEYNTRKFVGLTPTPIDNPSFQSIMSVIKPTKNNYYFFIADVDSIIRYAEDFAGHQFNIDTYGLVQ